MRNLNEFIVYKENLQAVNANFLTDVKSSIKKMR